MRRTDAARFLSNTPADITSATARSAAIAANRMKSNSASFSPSALLGLPPSAFLVPNVEMLEAAYKENIPGELRDNPGSMVLLSNGYSCEQLQPFAATLGCKVIVVLTGWTKDDVDEERKDKDKGRGSRGITLVVLRKQTSEDGRCPLLTTDDEETPTIADGAAVRVVMTPFSDQPAGSAEEDGIVPSTHAGAACMGGHCKDIYELHRSRTRAPGGEWGRRTWVRRTLATVTIPRSERLMVSLFSSYGVSSYGAYEKEPKLGITPR